MLASSCDLYGALGLDGDAEKFTLAADGGDGNPQVKSSSAHGAVPFERGDKEPPLRLLYRLAIP